MRRGVREALAILGAIAVAAGSRGMAQGDRERLPHATPATQGNRAPYDIAFSPDGTRAYATESAEGTVAVIDAESLAPVGRFPSGGEGPAGLAVTPDGRAVLVANSVSGTLAILDAATGRLRQRVPLPGMPVGVAVAPDGSRAYVSVSQLDEVAVVELPSGRETARIPVGRRPRALALTPDGTTLVAGNMAGGSLSQIDTRSLRETARVRLKGVNVRGVAVTGDGTAAYATVMPAFNARPTADALEIWHNLVQAVRLDGETPAPGEDQWLDFVRIPGATEVVGSPDQEDLVIDAASTYAWIAVGGRDVVTRITIRDRKRDAVWPISQIETLVGANPRGLALRPGERQVWVANHLGNSISVVDAAAMKVVRTIDLGPASRPDPAIRGRHLFVNAGLTRSHRFTCNSCHPDGASDGLTWTFTHVSDGFARRNTRDLRGGIERTAPFRWSGLEEHLDEFVEAEVTGLLRGPKPTRAETEALVAAIRSFQLPPNPFRGPDGRFTPEAERGRALFEGKAGCASCHGGPLLGGTGRHAWIGTTPEGRPVDIPHLVGAYDSAPYLHDGRAPTLESIFRDHNPRRLHGQAHRLTDEELAAVLRYVREL